MSSSDLYGKPKPKNEIATPISSASSIALSSELSRLVAQKSSSGGAATKGKKRPLGSKSKTDDIFKRTNKGVSSRAARDESATDERRTTSKDIGYIDDAALRKSRKMMEEKTRLYNAMKRGDYIPPAKKRKGGWAGAEEERAGSLIDFDRKWAEKRKERRAGAGHDSDASQQSSSSGGGGHESDSDDAGSDISVHSDDGEVVEHEDEFGRSRQMTKRELRKLKLQEQRDAAFGAGPRRAVDSDDEDSAMPAAPRHLIHGDAIQTAAFDALDFSRRVDDLDEKERQDQDAHYDATAEIRTKGVAFYQFSKDNEARKKEMEALKAERERTEKERIKREERKEERRREVERRREELKKRRQDKVGEKWLTGFMDELGKGKGGE